MWAILEEYRLEDSMRCSSWLCCPEFRKWQQYSWSLSSLKSIFKLDRRMQKVQCELVMAWFLKERQTAVPWKSCHLWKCRVSHKLPERSEGAIQPRALVGVILKSSATSYPPFSPPPICVAAFSFPVLRFSVSLPLWLICLLLHLWYSIEELLGLFEFQLGCMWGLAAGSMCPLSSGLVILPAGHHTLRLSAGSLPIISAAQIALQTVLSALFSVFDLTSNQLTCMHDEADCLLMLCRNLEHCLARFFLSLSLLEEYTVTLITAKPITHLPCSPWFH